MTDNKMPVSFKFESVLHGSVPVTLCACGSLLYQPMAEGHAKGCDVLLSALLDQERSDSQRVEDKQ